MSYVYAVHITKTSMLESISQSIRSTADMELGVRDLIGDIETFASAELAFEYAEQNMSSHGYNSKWNWSSDGQLSATRMCGYTMLLVIRVRVHGGPDLSCLTEGELDDLTVAIDRQRNAGVGVRSYDGKPLLELINSIPERLLLRIAAHLNITAHPPSRVTLELRQSPFMIRLVRSMKMTGDAEAIVGGVCDEWFSEFRDGAELPRTEAFMVLLFAMMRSNIALGKELCDALAKSERSEMIRLRRFAVAVNAAGDYERTRAREYRAAIFDQLANPSDSSGRQTD